MSSSEETWGGLNSLELGALIVGCGVAAIILIILSFVCIYRTCMKDNSKPKSRTSSQRMLTMSTQRTVEGQSMQQVIVKSQPNGNMDKQNQNDIPYRTMDTETNTVRYETGDTRQSASSQDVMITFHENDGTDKRIVTAEENEEVDSGTGASPVRVDISDGQQNAAFTGDDEVTENPDEADHEDETPYGYYPPPPPMTMPPPLTPGTPVTDLDEDETRIVPEPPPPPADDTYAEIRKDRPRLQVDTTQEPASSSDDPMKNIWQPRSPAEIQIIEKAKF